METSPKGIAEIAGHEGIVTSPYRDSVGVWTWGVGHTASAGSPDPATMARTAAPISEALRVFRRDLARYERGVAKAVTAPLRPAQFDALVSFHFNTGGIGRAKLTERLNAGDFTGAVAGFDGWHRPPEIIPRRDREKRLFRDGIYAHDGKANVYPADARGRVQWAKGRRIDVLELIDPLREANDNEAEATKDAGKAAAAGTVGGGAGVGGGEVQADPLSTVPEPLLKWVLIGLGAAFLVIAIAYGVRAWRRRRRAKALDDTAAWVLSLAQSNGEQLAADDDRHSIHVTAIEGE